jgi:autotransporter-associated beta strand protein
MSHAVKSRLAILALLIAGLFPAVAPAQTGSWSQAAGGTYNWSQASNWQAGIVADGANNTATFATTGLTGNVSVNLETPRTLGALFFDNPTNTSGWSISGSTLTLSSTNTPTITVNKTAITATVASVLAGTQGFTKTGIGTLNLTGTNTYSGGTTISDGTLGVNADSALGSGPLTISALGVLNYTANASTSRSFALAGGSIATSAGVTLTVNGGTLAGGYVGGAGTFATDPTNGARFVNSTALPSVNITSNSPNDRFTNFTNGGKLTIAPGVNASGANTVANLNGFNNQGAGAVTVGAGSRVSVANFQSFGVVAVNPATVNGQFSLLTNTGNSVLSFNWGSRTFIGTAATAATFVAGMDLHGQNAVLTGSFFSNNGFVADSVGGGSVIVDAGSLYKGVGTTFVNIITQNGGQVRAGDCPGGSVFGGLIIGPGGVNSVQWQINDAKGAGGPTPDANNNVSGWSQVQASKVANPVTNQVSTGNVTWAATPANRFSFALQTLLNPTPLGADNLGPMANFEPAHSYAWPVITFEGTYAGPTDSATLTADTLFDLSGFQNPHPGTFGMQFDAGNRSIDLVYSPSAVPEPGTLALTALGGLGLIRAISRRSRG